MGCRGGKLRRSEELEGGDLVRAGGGGGRGDEKKGRGEGKGQGG